MADLSRSPEAGGRESDSTRRPKKDEFGYSSWILAKTSIENWGHPGPPEGMDIFFLIWCLIGLILDPIFLYIPIIDDKNKCLGLDKKLSIAAVILRSLSDLPLFLALIGITCTNIADGFTSDYVKPESDWLQRLGIPRKALPFFLPITHLIAFAKALVAGMRLFGPAEVIFFLVTLPIPQVAILVFFFRMRSFGYFYKSAFLNAFLFLQYPLKLYFLYKVMEHIMFTKKWVKASFNLVLYICASHVIGAFWYFFSVQRGTICWHHACRDTPGCTATYYCDDTSNPTSIGILYELCPINPQNATLFDFGIFLDAFQSGISGQRNFSTKLFYCLWWGIRNLSNFGTNLVTSSYIWENCFAILISIIGLVLFLYFIGNVQLEFSEEMKELRSKLMKKNEVLESWVKSHNLSSDIREELLMKQTSGENWKNNIDVDVDVKGQLSILSQSQKDLTVVHLCMDTLKKVPMLRNRDEQVLKKICKHLKPVVYTENSYIVRAGEPLDLMLFIIDGIIWTYKTSDDNAEKTKMMEITWLKKGDFYGGELLSCTSADNSLSHLPISTENVRCKTKVEAFALVANDLRDMVSESWWGLTNDNNSQQLELVFPCNTIDETQNEVSKWEILRSRVRTSPRTLTFDEV